jgi:hypothetical protein
LNVVDAFVVPTGVGSASRGRRPIKVKPTGGYRVVSGQGPAGTDVVRLYIELEEPVQAVEGSDVYCPAGRVYGTCGYFLTHAAKSSESRSCKDIVAEEYHAAVTKYEEMRLEKDEDDRVFAWDQLKRMKEMMDLKAEINKLALRLQEVRQREPERSQLRMSRRGDVALSKEGGVCCKVQKGLAMEYHILGRMELASVEPKEEHDDYEELVHELHPNEDMNNTNLASS